MGHPDWSALTESCEGVRNRVSEYFNSLLTLPEGQLPEVSSSTDLQYVDLSVEALVALGFRNATTTWEAVVTTKLAPRSRSPCCATEPALPEASGAQGGRHVTPRTLSSSAPDQRAGLTRKFMNERLVEAS